MSHARSTHKIGTDGVLLGAWVETTGAKTILDVGTGSGVIALMLAQKSDDDTTIDGIDLNADDVQQAIENVWNSPWPEKVKIHHTSLQNYQPSHRYDLIVSNPPYFINSWLPPDASRSVARHTEELTFDELLDHATKLLSKTGRLAVVLPYEEGMQFRSLAANYGLHLQRELHFRSRSSKPVERLLMQFGFQAVQSDVENLVLHGEGESWSDDYRELTKEFYLKA